MKAIIDITEVKIIIEILVVANVSPLFTEPINGMKRASKTIRVNKTAM